MHLTHVTYAAADRIATITVNRPDKLNALNDAVMADIDAAFAHAKSDAACGVVILTGAGEKAFVAGADIGELATQTVRGGKETDEDDKPMLPAVAPAERKSLLGTLFGGGKKSS